MRAAIVLVLRCGLAVTVTTAAVQLWSMALQDDVPLPAPILALPVTDAAVAAARPRRVPAPTQPAVVVSVQLMARAGRPPGPAASPRRFEPARPSREPRRGVPAPLHSPWPAVAVSPPSAVPPPPPTREPEPAPAAEDPTLTPQPRVTPRPLDLPPA